MDTEVMEKKLYSACLKGDTETLKAMMEEDGLTLARVSISSYFTQTPLHLASMLGHFEFSKTLLSYESGYASRLDSQGRSPLHLASANGRANIVELLLGYDEKMCKVLDEDGRTPLHLAVMNSQYDSVKELIKVNVSEPYKGLHLCVTYNRLDVLILILESNDMDLSEIKDDHGNTILHSAAALRRIQIIKYLVTNRSAAEVEVLNKNGLTALGMIMEIPEDVKTMEIKQLLISAGTLRVKKSKSPAETGNIYKQLLSMWNKVRNFTIFQEKIEKRDESLLIAASVIAAMAYTSAISPPGGVASMDAVKESDKGGDPFYDTYYLEPTRSLLAYFFPGLSNTFWRANTVAFMAALSVIFIYVTGASVKQKVFVWMIRAAMWVTLSSMIIAYVAAVEATTPKYYDNVKTDHAVEATTPDYYDKVKTDHAVVIGLYCRKYIKCWRLKRRNLFSILHSTTHTNKYIKLTNVFHSNNLIILDDYKAWEIVLFIGLYGTY